MAFICTILDKRTRKPKKQPRMDNPEKLATMGTQDTGRRQATQKTKKDEQHRPHQKPVVNSDAREGQVVPVSYLLQDTHHVTQIVRI